jgi:hypothetical protein
MCFFSGFYRVLWLFPACLDWLHPLLALQHSTTEARSTSLLERSLLYQIVGLKLKKQDREMVQQAL